MTTIVWFRQHLRTRDNLALAAAAARQPRRPPRLSEEVDRWRAARDEADHRRNATGGAQVNREGASDTVASSEYDRNASGGKRGPRRSGRVSASH